MLFRQIRATGSVQCAYLIGDIRTGAAVLIDPVPSMADDVAALLERHHLELHGVLETFVRREPAEAIQSRFSEMVRLLGAKIDGSAASDVALPWSDVERGGPIEPWRAPSSDAAVPRVLFSWRRSIRELCPQATEVFDPMRDTLTLQFGAAAVRIGDLEILALPVGDRPDAVAYLVGDRLVTGAALWSDPSAPAGPRTGTAIVDLPADTWVYPRRVGDAERGTMHDELMAWRHHHSSDRTAPPLDERGFLPVVASTGDSGRWTAPPIGSRHPAGYVDVVPADALVHINSFARVVVVGDPGRVARTILGAEIRPHRDVVRFASAWAEDEPILVTSEVGELCRATARALLHNGIRHVYRLVGGITFWESCGLPAERAWERRRRA